MARKTSLRIGAIALVCLLAGLATFFALRPAAQGGGPAASPERQQARTGDAALSGSGGAGIAAAAGSDGGEEPGRGNLRLTVPALGGRIDGVAVPTAAGSDEEALRENAAIHVRGTGLPSERGSNVYIAGHRVGYAGTRSEGAFRDIDRLGKGDAVLLADASGKSYRYRVYEVLRVDPTDLSVLAPVPGKSIVTLQSCTYPDYTDRIVVRAERVAS
jgi:sortase A